MKRLLLAFIALSLTGARANAAAIELTPFANYTTVNMATVNQGIASAYSFLNIISLIGPPEPIVFKNNAQLNSGYVLGAELMTDRLTPWEGLSLGLRGQYLQTGLAQVSTLPNMFIPDFDYELYGNLSSFMLGLRYQLGGIGNFSVSTGAFAGMGYAEMHEAMGFIMKRSLYHGEGFVGDLDVRIDWKPSFVKHVGLNALLGYRYASLGQLSDSGGDVLRPPVTNVINAMGGPGGNVPLGGGVDVDFGGFNVGGGISLYF